MTGHKKRRFELTTEIHEKIIIRRSSSEKTFCEICNCSVRLFSPLSIIQKLNSELDETKQNLFEEKLHFVGKTEMICGNSLADYFLNSDQPKNK